VKAAVTTSSTKAIEPMPVPLAKALSMIASLEK
jgi:hypothetical protein